MTELPHHNPEEELPAFDRKTMAIALREVGVDIDFEDWDGLDDEEVLGAVTTLAAMYGVDIEDIFAQANVDVEKVEAPVDRRWIAEALQKAGVTTLDETTLNTLPDDALPRMIAWHAKEVGIAGEALEDLGYKCLDEKWEKGRWI